MKKFNLHSSAALVAILLLWAVFSACNFGTNYKYTWKVAVTYSNGEKDTITCSYDSFKGNECFIRLKISESGFISSGGTDPCVIVGCGFYQEPVVCGVRSFNVLSLDKVLLK